jgi:TRAP-type C4-dicarboxylate transport system substrate-binding protein
MVGTHFPEERDVVQSALQRMREAFEGLRDGQLDAGTAEDLFLAGYDDLLDATSVLFLTRSPQATGRGASRDDN